ncbi:YbxH family protein [Bacillus sp. REN3]|uniref:YbxH family protein n=1 Tax=Bacillus sp. REN3 TaxID=2802440 RepID=UPI001AEEB4D6
MGAVEQNGFVFEPEFSVIGQNGAIHVFKNGKFIEEIQFVFSGEYPEFDEIQQLIDNYCEQNSI